MVFLDQPLYRAMSNTRLSILKCSVLEIFSNLEFLFLEHVLLELIVDLT
jgi:hypothetical protein